MRELDCDATVERLSRYVDRELSDAELAEVHAHLDDCPPCERIFEFNAHLKRLVRKECCSDDAPTRLREWVRNLQLKDPRRPA